MHLSYIGFGIGSVSDVQLAQRQECNFSRQVHFVELHKNFSTDFICIHNVVEQPREMPAHQQLSSKKGKIYIKGTPVKINIK